MILIIYFVFATLIQILKKSKDTTNIYKFTIVLCISNSMQNKQPDIKPKTITIITTG